jgi:hypothetical protein
MPINNTKTKIWFLFAVVFFCTNASAKEPITPREITGPVLEGKAPLTHIQERRFAEYLEEETKKYLDELKSISSLTFKGRSDLSAETAIALKSELDIVIIAMESMLQHLERPKNNQDVYSVMSWTLVTRQISSSLSYMEDLDRWGLVRSQWHIRLRIYLPGIFDTLIVPKQLKLMRESRIVE